MNLYDVIFTFILERITKPSNRKIEERGQIIEQETESVSVNSKPHIIIAASLLATGVFFFIASIILIIAHCRSKKVKISETDEESGNESLSRKSGMSSNNIKYVMKILKIDVDYYTIYILHKQTELL